MEDIIKAVNLFKVFSDETRFKIIMFLGKNEYCVSDISEHLSMTQSSISHQLAYLKKYNIVKCRRQNKNIYYSLIDEHIYNLMILGYTHANEC